MILPDIESACPCAVCSDRRSHVLTSATLGAAPRRSFVSVAIRATIISAAGAIFITRDAVWVPCPATSSQSEPLLMKSFQALILPFCNRLRKNGVSGSMPVSKTAISTRRGVESVICLDLKELKILWLSRESMIPLSHFSDNALDGLVSRPHTIEC